MQYKIKKNCFIYCFHATTTTAPWYLSQLTSPSKQPPPPRILTYSFSNPNMWNHVIVTSLVTGKLWIVIVCVLLIWLVKSSFLVFWLNLKLGYFMWSTYFSRATDCFAWLVSIDSISCGFHWSRVNYSFCTCFDFANKVFVEMSQWIWLCWFCAGHFSNDINMLVSIYYFLRIHDFIWIWLHLRCFKD